MVDESGGFWEEKLISPNFRGLGAISLKHNTNLLKKDQI